MARAPREPAPAPALAFRPAMSATTLVEEPPRADSPAGGRAARPWRHWRTGLAALGVGVASVAIAAWALKLWRADLALPLRYSPVDDTKFYLALVKGIISGGWWTHNADLGAPYGSQLLDFPQGGDNLNLALIWLLGRFTSNPALVTNLFYLATFALASTCCFAVLRALGISRRGRGRRGACSSRCSPTTSSAASRICCCRPTTPYRSSCYLFLRVLDGGGLFARRPAGPRALRWCSGRTLGTVAICVVIGSENLYYATFAVVMLAGGVLGALLARRGAAALGGMAAMVLIALDAGREPVAKPHLPAAPRRRTPRSCARRPRTRRTG